MRIGIDIDDTITNSWDVLAKEYAKIFDVPESILINSIPYYNNIIKTKCTLDEYFKNIIPINDAIVPNIPLKENVKETIDKLYELGHTVFFITSRGKENTNAYQITKDYLDKHKIKYEKLILGIRSKAEVCINERIDLHIDDSIKHCTAISEAGIDVLMFETKYNKEFKQFKHVKNWNEIYEYIKSR